MTPKHCSDQRLLAYVDGEQSLIASALTRRHLQSCWECRARVAQLEAAAHQLTSARARSPFLPPSRVESARRQVLNAIAVRPYAAPRTLWTRAAAYGLLTSLGLAGAAGLWDAWRPSVAEPPRRPVASRPAPPAPNPPLAAVSVPPRVSRQPAPLPSAEPVAPAHPLARDADAAVVWAILHDLGLCRGRFVRLIEDGPVWRLTGVVPNAAKQGQLAVRLQSAGVTLNLDLTSIEDIPLPPVAPAPQERVGRFHAPGEALLVSWFKTQGLSPSDAAARSSEAANAAVLAADLAWSEAWSLRDLAARFGQAWALLPDSARSLVLSMSRDHWSELQTIAARQRQLLGGILPLPPAPSSDWFTALEDWPKAAQEMFAPATPVQTDPSVLSRRIAAALAGIEAMGGDDPSLATLLRAAPHHAHLK
ncbi:MAG: hypothetical protein JNK48_26040 [Bryobacterales bacterium]|nr:hypothetical protein [Bryobacterales bacterium]